MDVSTPVHSSAMRGFVLLSPKVEMMAEAQSGGREGRVDFVGFCPRAEFGGVGETVGVDVCDDDGAGARCLAAK